MTQDWNQVINAYMLHVDKNNDGFISRDELKDFFEFASKHQKINFNAQAFDDAYNKAEVSGDGKLSKEELLSFLQNLSWYK